MISGSDPRRAFVAPHAGDTVPMPPVLCRDRRRSRLCPAVWHTSSRCPSVRASTLTSHLGSSLDDYGRAQPSRIAGPRHLAACRVGRGSVGREDHSLPAASHRLDHQPGPSRVSRSTRPGLREVLATSTGAVGICAWRRPACLNTLAALEPRALGIGAEVGNARGPPQLFARPATTRCLRPTTTNSTARRPRS